MDTIFASATASGKAGVSIIRISGPAALDVCRDLGVDLAPHDRRLANLKDEDGGLIDQAFVLSFAPGQSFTSEQVVELQTHGSPAIVTALSRRLSGLGLRMAEAGEFTRRAMENGVLDLARVEGLADLIDAETEGQRRQAMRVFAGDLGTLTSQWRTKLVRAASLLEATIDFVDEDVPVDVIPEVSELVRSVSEEVAHEVEGVKTRERVRDGFEIALIGPPNVGKSSLLNRLAGRDAAMTSEIEGTTRDVIEVRMDLSGLPVTVLDTAGLRASDDPLEEMGILRGRQRAAMADVRVHLSVDGNFVREEFEHGLDFFVQSKSDLRTSTSELKISSKTGDGIELLLNRIEQHLSGLVLSAGIATRERHAVTLSMANEGLSRVLCQLDDGQIPIDLLADDLRVSIRSLDSLIGRVDVENLLDEIFSSFCIGK